MGLIRPLRIAIKTPLDMTGIDILLIVATLGAAIIGIIFLPKLGLPSNQIEIYQNNRIYGRYDLRHNKIIEVPGPLGSTCVEIKSGAARIISSPCPHKICVGMAPIGNKGDFLLCLPNGVLVKWGAQTSDVDAVSR